MRGTPPPLLSMRGRSKQRWKGERAKNAEAMQERLILRLKFFAGAVRFTVEDVLNGWCQMVYLLRYWHSKELTESSRWFTVMSIAASIALSLVGPAKEYISFRRLEHLYTMIDAAEVQEKEVARGEQLIELTLQRGSDSGAVLLQPGLLPRWQNATLVIASGTFWLAMAMIPVLLRAKMKKANVPMSTVMYFVLTGCVCVFMELCVVVHTRHGLHFIQNMGVHLTKAFHGHAAGSMGVLALVLSLLGRYDTVGDVVFTLILFKDAEHTGMETTWFTIGVT